MLFTISIVALMIAGYVGALLITPLDLKWQAATSTNRLIVQIWPALLITAFAGMPRLEQTATQAPAVHGKARKKAKA
jgi:hypothetical protein